MISVPPSGIESVFPALGEGGAYVCVCFCVGPLLGPSPPVVGASWRRRLAGRRRVALTVHRRPFVPVSCDILCMSFTASVALLSSSIYIMRLCLYISTQILSYIIIYR